MSGYSGNKIPVGESFHMRNSGSQDQIIMDARKSYNEQPTNSTGKDDKNSLNKDEDNTSNSDAPVL